MALVFFSVSAGSSGLHAILLQRLLLRAVLLGHIAARTGAVALLQVQMLVLPLLIARLSTRVAATRLLAFTCATALAHACTLTRIRRAIALLHATALAIATTTLALACTLACIHRAIALLLLHATALTLAATLARIHRAAALLAIATATLALAAAILGQCNTATQCSDQYRNHHHVLVHIPLPSS